MTNAEEVHNEAVEAGLALWRAIDALSETGTDRPIYDAMDKYADACKAVERARFEPLVEAARAGKGFGDACMEWLASFLATENEYALAGSSFSAGWAAALASITASPTEAQ